MVYGYRCRGMSKLSETLPTTENRSGMKTCAMSIGERLALRMHASMGPRYSVYPLEPHLLQIVRGISGASMQRNSMLATRSKESSGGRFRKRFHRRLWSCALRGKLPAWMMSAQA